MAKFRYVGIDDVSSPAEVYHYGTRFEMGQVSEVTDPVHAQKLERQEGFEKVGDEEESIGDRSIEKAKETAKLSREHAREIRRRQEEIEAFARDVNAKPLPPLGREDQDVQNRRAEADAGAKGEGELQQQHQRDLNEDVQQEQQYDIDKQREAHAGHPVQDGTPHDVDQGY
jgi:hypothetical protein